MTQEDARSIVKRAKQKRFWFAFKESRSWCKLLAFGVLAEGILFSATWLWTTVLEYMRARTSPDVVSFRIADYYTLSQSIEITQTAGMFSMKVFAVLCLLAVLAASVHKPLGVMEKEHEKLRTLVGNEKAADAAVEVAEQRGIDFEEAFELVKALSIADDDKSPETLHSPE